MRNEGPLSVRETLFETLRDAARGEDEGVSFAPSVRVVLAYHGFGTAATSDTVHLLVAVAEANLPVARLVEGHINARDLIDCLAPDSMPNAAILGVWGADADDPVHFDGSVLSGTKQYASGLGVVTHALVTVAWDDTARLALVDVSDITRHRPEAWTMLGMRATMSGKIDLAGLIPLWIGNPGDYFAEPAFVGGVWRIAALQLGGTLSLLAAARDALAKRGRLDADAQISRLAQPLARALAAFGLVERAATVAQGPQGRADPDRAVALSIQARLLTEDLAQDAIAAVERSIGLPHFDRASTTGRIARDLATYCRQAARDTMEQRAGRILLCGSGPLSGIWYG